MLQPARYVAASGVSVCPVDDAAFGVPFILTRERYSVAVIQGWDAGRDVDVVGDQQGLTGCQLEDEALMATAVVVVREHASDHPVTADLNATLLGSERIVDRRICRRGGTWRRRLTGADARRPGLDRCQAQQDQHNGRHRHDPRESLRVDGLLWLAIPLITHLHRAGAALLVDTQPVEDHIMKPRTPTSVLELADVNEHAWASRERRDKPKASGVIPLGESALLIHRISVGMSLEFSPAIEAWLGHDPCFGVASQAALAPPSPLPLQDGGTSARWGHRWA